MSVLQTDADGYAIPAADILADQLIECTALEDCDYGEPADWPDWTDRWVWEEGPASPSGAQPELEGLARYLIDPELAEWLAYGNCHD